MKFLKYLLVGFIFGIVLTKSEAVSWYRIYEMFKFQSFHMFGIIGTALFVGVVGIQLIKRKQLKDINNETIVIPNKEPGNTRYWIGGLLFGLGWALVGSCPGPIFILIGAGFMPVLACFSRSIVGNFPLWAYQKQIASLINN